MEITGRIIAVLEERSGKSARTGSDWRVASYVLETVEQYPKKICFEVFGADRIQSLNIQAGESLTVRFDIDAHEYNGRWFNSIRAFAVDRNVQQPAMGTVNATLNQAPFESSPVASPAFPPASEDNGDLPF